MSTLELRMINSICNSCCSNSIHLWHSTLYLALLT